jgi:GH25 family lysozyme M1 (1,4-beta-N-acetylmuramidase)
MSKQSPIFGIDISGWQPGDMDLTKAKSEGYEFCVVKATEGPHPDGSTYDNPYYEQQFANAKAAGMVVGSYHYLVEAPAKPQVDHFLATIGDASGQLIMIDYEEYNKYPELSPRPNTLDEFLGELKSRVGSHPILLYSGRGYWNEPPPNSDIDDDQIVTWDANYPYDANPVGTGPELYTTVWDWDQAWGKRWGGKEPIIWQFSGATPVAGVEQVDVNAFRGTREELRSLTGEGKRMQKKKKEEAARVDGYEARIVIPDERGWLKDKGSGLWIAGPEFCDIEVYRSGPWIYTTVDGGGSDKTDDFAWPEANDPVGYWGDGSYIDYHPTRYTWRADVEEVARYLVQTYKCWVNTYVDHPPGWGLDTTSLDIWGPGDRGDDIWNGTGDDGFYDIFNNGKPPWIRWCIRDGWIWDDYNGWREYWDTDPWSDAGHWHHRHITFY